MSFAQRMKKLRLESEMSQAEVAQKLGISASSVSMYENGNREPEIATFEAIADLFNVDMDYLKGKADAKRKNDYGVFSNSKTRHFIPVLGRVRAGEPGTASEEVLYYTEINEDLARQGDHFGLIIHGDSMAPTIADGDVVVVRKQSDVDSGTIAIVLINGTDATCKKVVKNNGCVSLVPFNHAYDTLMYTREEIEEIPVQIIGKVTELRRHF